jgi:hypothetical protein
MPPLDIEYAEQVKNYFVDNGDYTGNLLGEIERLRYADDGLPEENYTELGEGIIEWKMLDHWVYYRVRGRLLEILAVKPL